MCTVTYIPLKNNVFITTNRDEHILRPRAIPPDCYIWDNKKMIYPQDSKAGGTWVTICENGNAAVLLNGAIDKHQQKFFYKKSRGLILLDIMKSDKPVQSFKDFDLNEIEAFTIIIRQNNLLYECRWDEVRKFVILLDHNISQSWSSCTLYDSDSQENRKKEFQNWLSRNPDLTTNDIISFHKTACFENEITSLTMDGQSPIKTVSITSLNLTGNEAIITYNDQLQNKEHISRMHFINGGIIA